MKKNELKQSISYLENILNDFREAKAKGKATNSNEERAQSIADIEEITRRLEIYFQSNGELLEQITGTEIEVTGNVEWNDVIRPAHFEEDLAAEIDRLKKKTL